MTENKRFTMCHEQNDINGWTMSIIDWETKEPFNYTTYEVHSSSITDTKDEMEDLYLLLNELHDENQVLKEPYADDYNEANSMTVKISELTDENEQLQNQIDELEDDNEKYSKSLNKLEDYTKRFIPTKCLNEFKDCKTNRYYWLDHEGNFEGALELLNLMDCENEQLKQQKDKWKQQCIHFKEMLDDMDIAYLCDEWIYEELKGGVE